MAAKDRSTQQLKAPLTVVDSLTDQQRQDRQRMEARRQAGINETLASRIGDMDHRCSFTAGYVENLCRAIKVLAATNETLIIESLADQAIYWAMDVANDVNVFAEDLGCNVRERDLLPTGAACTPQPSAASSPQWKRTTTSISPSNGSRT